MNIIEKTDIINIILSKAKFQKVMLIFDDTVSNLEIIDLHNQIKEYCIYNQFDISKQHNIDIVNDGYKLLIFFCSADSYLKINQNIDEFINIFIPTVDNFLPFYLNNKNELSSSQNYIVFNSNIIDIPCMTSVYFSKFYSCIKNLVNMKSNHIEFSFSSENNIGAFIEELNCLSDIYFKDIEIIKSCDIDYEQLPLVDYILISAFSLLINSVKNHNLFLVDVCKACADNYALVDKFYAMYNNDLLINMINLNYYYLSTAVNKTREKILEILSVSYQYNEKDLKSLIEKIKLYAKQDDGIIGYLYLYDIFSV